MPLVDAARKYMGVKWKHIGRNEFGLDCAGLVLLSCADVGYNFDDVDEYPRRPRGYDFVRQVSARLVRADITNIKENDIVLFRDQLYPCHVGIIGKLNGALSVVHSHAKIGRVVEEYFDPVWRSRMSHVFKLPEK